MASQYPHKAEGQELYKSIITLRWFLWSNLMAIDFLQLWTKYNEICTFNSKGVFNQNLDFEITRSFLWLFLGILLKMVLKSCWKPIKDLGKIYLLIPNLKHFTYFGLEGVRNFKRFVWFLFDIASLRCASRLVFILTTLWPYWTCYWNIIQLIRNLLLCFPIVLIRFWNILILSDPAKKTRRNL